jgi:hypothetical protein
MRQEESSEGSVSRDRRIGVSRPALEIEDLPTPEEVFKLKRIGIQELILFVLGPGIIIVTQSIGSGEWMLGPLAVGQYGFSGIGWVIFVSILLQTIYNIELARFTVATGEPPIIAFGRTPPGSFLWIPLALICFYLAFMMGGWAVSAGSSLFALYEGRPHQPEEISTIRLLGSILLVTTFFFVSFGRRIERSLEISMTIFAVFILSGLVCVTLAVVPLEYSARAFASLVFPGAPPPGTDPSLLGALAGFAGLASGLNFMSIGYYRDKGYGMGSRTGYIAALIGGKKVDIVPAGKIFPEDEKNAACWRRWFKYLLMDQWIFFFTGSVIGMMAPSILVGYLSGLPGAEHPSGATILVYAALQLGQKYGPLLFGWSLLMGFFILYSTQIITVEVLTRNITDAVYCSRGRLRNVIPRDPRLFYYSWMLFIVFIIGITIQHSLPLDLIIASANMANFASMIFPLMMIYLNLHLPRPARIKWWSCLALVGNSLFFGFFFINFLAFQLAGVPLVRF